MQEKFIKFFTGLERNYGFCDLSNAKVNPETGKLDIPPKDYGWSGKPITDETYIDHLEGKISIGIQPCNEEGNVVFGAIDVDIYKNFNVEKFFKKIVDNQLPLIPVKSKSGGFHLYLHTSEPISAVFARQFLKSLLFTLGLKTTTEIYPKQTNVEDSVGNFINIPYFGRNERVAVNPNDGKEFTFDQYIKVVEFNQKTKKELEDFMNKLTKKELVGGSEEFIDGPPCLQQLSKDKLDDGRDRFLYNYMVFAKKKYPDDWEEKIKIAAREYFVNDNKWDDNKVKQKIRSWQKTATGYTCEDGVITEVCMEELCYKRKFGKKSDKIIQWPHLSSLVKISYEEPEYDLTVTVRDKNGDEKSKQIHLKSYEELSEMRLLKRSIGKQVNIHLPALKAKDFDPILHELMSNIEDQSPPAGTSNKEKLFKHIKEYIHGVKATSHASFETGATLFRKDKVYFIYDRFYDFLKRKDWKHDDSKTGFWMKKWFEAEFDKKPRYPKKDTQTEENPQVPGCVLLKAPMFEKERAPDEIIDMKDKEDIL